MEKKILKVTIYQEPEEWGGGIHSQEVSSKDYDHIHYSVYNMCDCPEDAMIGRDLFSAEDYVDALKLGMKLAEMGYTDIETDYNNSAYEEDE